MKLLLDHNLSRHLVPPLTAAFAGTTHVAMIRMDRADDADIWTYAAANGFTIVTKDTDFHQRAFLLGHPPKVREPC